MTKSSFGVTRFFALFDLHVPNEDPTVVKIARDFHHDFKPHISVAGGDWQDVGMVSTFADEDTIDLADEFDAVNSYMDMFKVTHWLEGNHEERLRRVGLSNPRLRKILSPALNLNFEKRGTHIFPYHRKRGILKLGKLKVLHGFYTNEYVARKTSDAFGCCVFGHAHRFQSYQPKTCFEGRTGFSIGCGAKLDLPYASSRPPQGWMQGFVFGYILKSGHFSIYPVRIVGPEVIINGKPYTRR